MHLHAYYKANIQISVFEQVRKSIGPSLWNNISTDMGRLKTWEKTTKEIEGTKTRNKAACGIESVPRDYGAAPERQRERTEKKPMSSANTSPRRRL